MNQGWIKLYRSLLENGWLKNHELLPLWVYLLLRASHKAHSVNLKVKRGEGFANCKIYLKAGQVITGRKAIAKDLGLSETTVRTLLKQLEKAGSISIDATKSFSTISIANWEEYQHAENSVTINEPSTDQHLTTYNNVNNEKNKTNNTPSSNTDDLSSFVSILKRNLDEFGYSFTEEDLKKRLKKSWEQGWEGLLVAAFDIVLSVLEEGKKLDDPISYGLGILKNKLSENST
jgi:predicted transcriptional regulator